MRASTRDTLRLPGEDGRELIVRYDNRGEPYREGVGIELIMAEWETITSVFLEAHEAIQLRDLLLKMYPLPEAR